MIMKIMMNKILTALVLIFGLSGNLFSASWEELDKAYDDECFTGIEKGRDISDANDYYGTKKFFYRGGIYELYKDGRCIVRKFSMTGKYCELGQAECESANKLLGNQ